MPTLRARLATVALVLVACRPEPSSTPEPEPAPPVPLSSVFPALAVEPATRVDLSPDPLPDGVVAKVDGEPIFEAELVRLTQAAADQADPTQVRSDALLQLVERRLVEANADRMEILVTDDELTRAVEGVASTNGLSVEQLEAAVVDQGWTWEEYGQELMAQIIEMKVLRVHGVLDPAPLGGATVEDRRQRLLGCMRARAEVQVDDEALTLPPNPFEVRNEIGELRFGGALGLTEDELRVVAQDAARDRMHLCDALTSAELALQELYMERGFLEAQVQLPWPATPTPPVIIEARVDAGRPHTVGKIAFDQSAVPRRQRLDEDELRDRVGLFLVHGELARMSAMQAASRDISDAFERGGLGPVEATVSRKEGKGSVRLDITYRLLGPPSPSPTPSPTQIRQ